MMNYRKAIKDIINSMYNKHYKNRFIKIEKSKMLDPRRKKLYSKVNFTSDEENEIQEYFQKYYGKKIDTRWHKLYQSFTGKYDKKYFPDIIFSSELEPLLCKRTISGVFSDKSMVELLYKGIEDLYIPQTIVVRCSGIFYDSNRCIITAQEAKKLLFNCGKRVIKKTRNSNSGQDVMIIDLKDGYDIKNNVSLDDLIMSFGDDFIVQELIKNSSEISKIYPNALNTFRVMTYVVDGKMYHVPIAMRIGQGGKEVDNIHAGGMFIGVSDNGKLMDKAFTEFQNVYEEHPDTHVKFKNYKIKGIDRVIQAAYKCHGRTPHLKLISWDFTIDEQDRVVLIEVNLNGQSIWFPQMANGKAAFGDNTGYMLSLIRENEGRTK